MLFPTWRAVCNLESILGAKQTRRMCLPVRIAERHSLLELLQPMIRKYIIYAHRDIELDRQVDVLPPVDPQVL
jgi:hypothetical protein